MDRLLTQTQAARLAGIATSTIGSLVAYGHLKVTPSGYDDKLLIAESELLRFCDKKWEQITDPAYTGRKFRMFSPEEVRRHLREY